MEIKTFKSRKKQLDFDKGNVEIPVIFPPLPPDVDSL